MAKLSKTPKAVGVSRDALRRQQEKRDAGRSEAAPKATRVALNNDADASIKLYEAAARMEGGPRHGFVYYVRDLEQEKRATESMGRKMAYKPTKAHTTLPATGGVKGVVWRYDP